MWNESTIKRNLPGQHLKELPLTNTIAMECLDIHVSVIVGNSLIDNVPNPKAGNLATESPEDVLQHEIHLFVCNQNAYLSNHGTDNPHSAAELGIFLSRLQKPDFIFDTNANQVAAYTGWCIMRALGWKTEHTEEQWCERFQAVDDDFFGQYIERMISSQWITPELGLSEKDPTIFDFQHRSLFPRVEYRQLVSKLKMLEQSN